jgi:single-stranded-DNA-specific exonuclease
MVEIKNLKKAANRILKAIQKNESIVLYGDADLDGACSVIILQDTIKSLGGKISAVYFPDREIEGYGITETGLKFLKKKTPALLIALDCGISNFKEVKLANKIGFNVIIVDHHEPLDELPEAEIIVDPKQKGDKYPFKKFACAGVAYKLSLAILKDKVTEGLKKSFLELTAIATIADMMPKESENKIFIEEGLSYLENSWRPGLKAFLNMEPFKRMMMINEKVSKVISILNIREVKNILPASFRLLSSSSIEEAEKIIKKSLKKAKIRNLRIKEIENEIEKKLEKDKEWPVIFYGDARFDSVIISSVASILCRRYVKPVFLYKKLAKESCGTVRAPKGINSVDLMKKCSKHLITFGGHAPASGFRLKNENLEKFKKCLIKNL